MAPLRLNDPSPPVLPARPVVNDLLTLWDSIAPEQNDPELTDADAALDAIEQSL